MSTVVSIPGLYLALIITTQKRHAHSDFYSLCLLSTINHHAKEACLQEFVFLVFTKAPARILLHQTKKRQKETRKVEIGWIRTKRTKKSVGLAKLVTRPPILRIMDWVLWRQIYRHMKGYAIKTKFPSLPKNWSFSIQR